MNCREIALNLASKIEDTDTKAIVTHSLTTDDRHSKVLAFHALYKVPIANKTDEVISHMSDERITLRLNLLIEEVNELLRDGFGINAKIDYSTTDGKFHGNNLLQAVKSSKYRNVVEVADALGDISYVVDGFAIEAGLNLDDVIGEIHASNMTKIGEDGSPIYRADNKVLKGPFFTEPNIEQVLFRK